MSDVTFRWLCIVVSIVFLAVGWVYYYAADVPSVWPLILMLVTAGVFSNLRP